MRNYTERYEYDAVGNFLQHDPPGARTAVWTRAYRYNETSLIEPGKNSNRLSSTIVHPNGNQPLEEPYTHDAHGNMIAMPHLTLMQWDFKDQLQATARQVVNDGTPETTYYVYDAGRPARAQGHRAAERHAQERADLPRRIRGVSRVRRQWNGVSLERETLACDG